MRKRASLCASSSSLAWCAVRSRMILTKPTPVRRRIMSPEPQNRDPSFRRCHLSSSLRPLREALERSSSGAPAARSSSVKITSPSPPRISSSEYPVRRSAPMFQLITFPDSSCAKTAKSVALSTISRNRSASSGAPVSEIASDIVGLLEHPPKASTLNSLPSSKLGPVLRAVTLLTGEPWQIFPVHPQRAAHERGGTEAKPACLESVRQHNMNLSQLSLFTPSALAPEGLQYCPEFVTAAEERTLIEHLAGLELEPFQFGAYEGKRRVVSFGHAHDFSLQRLDTAAEPPSWLGTYISRVERSPLAKNGKIAQVL